MRVKYYKDLNTLKKFTVIGWVYTVDFENQYIPYCRKVEREFRAYDEAHALYKFAASFNWFGVQHMEVKNKN